MVYDHYSSPPGSSYSSQQHVQLVACHMAVSRSSQELVYGSTSVLRGKDRLWPCVNFSRYNTENLMV